MTFGINFYKMYVLCVLLILSCSCFAKFHHHKDSTYLNHVQLVHQFRCSIPQTRAISVEELLSVGPSPDEIFFPPSTVLARCAGSGCCPEPKQMCGPIETRNVSRVFVVKHLIDQQRDRHHEIIHAIEHTKCSCIDRGKYDFSP